ncbi:MAG: phage terminase large subunit [Beijerinckiaceae bacterium]
MDDLLQTDDDEIQRWIHETSLEQFTARSWKEYEARPFLSNWDGEAISEHLEAVVAGQIRRLIINIPPRKSKSSRVTIAFPAWVWAQRTPLDPSDPEGKRRMAIEPGTLKGPGVRFITTSYADRLARGHSGRSRRILKSAWYQRLWGHRFSFLPSLDGVTNFGNDRGGQRFTTSTNGTITGEGGDIIIIDDPHNTKTLESDVEREAVIMWWDEVISTRLNDVRSGAFIVVMQRLHSQDLTGHILASETGWDHLCLPMRYDSEHPNKTYSSIGWVDPRTEDGELLDPERFPADELAKLEKRLGSYGTAGQMQQRPTPRSGGLFKKRWFETVGAAPTGGQLIRAWDFAGSKDRRSDYTVGALMLKTPDNVFYVLDIVRERVEGPEVKKLLLNTAAMDGPNVRISIPQDPGSAGKTLANDYVRALAGYSVRATAETGDKETRATPLASQAEAGSVKLVAGAWNRLFLEELSLFPNAPHDDQVDAASRAFNELAAKGKVVIIVPE